MTTGYDNLELLNDSIYVWFQIKQMILPNSLYQWIYFKYLAVTGSKLYHIYKRMASEWVNKYEH